MGSMIRLGLILSLFVWGWTGFAATVVSETIGSVGTEIFTSRQAALSGVMDRLLAGAKDPGPSPDSKKERAALLLEAAVAKEAESFSVIGADSDEVSQLAAKTRQHLQSRADWRKLEYSEKEIRDLAFRKTSARSLIKLKSESMKSSISDLEAQKYFEENRAKFGSMPFSSFRDQIKRVLAQQQLDERLRSWFEIVRRKYQVRDDSQMETAPPKK